MMPAVFRLFSAGVDLPLSMFEVCAGAVAAPITGKQSVWTADGGIDGGRFCFVDCATICCTNEGR